jgi:hypothetical protein
LYSVFLLPWFSRFPAALYSVFLLLLRSSSRKTKGPLAFGFSFPCCGAGENQGLLLRSSSSRKTSGANQRVGSCFHHTTLGFHVFLLLLQSRGNQRLRSSSRKTKTKGYAAAAGKLKPRAAEQQQQEN